MIRAFRFALIGLALSTMPAAALDRGPPAQSLGPVKATRIDTKAVTVTTGALAPCLSTDGAFALDGTNSWEPTCFGTFVSSMQDVGVRPTRGVVSTGNPIPGGTNVPSDYGMVTGNLIQARSSGTVAKEINGQFINMDVVGGPETAKRDANGNPLGGTNVTGQLISLRQRPGPAGQTPATSWGHNVDFHIAPNTGNVQSWGVEYDMNNFNKDCAPGAGTCLSAALYLNGLNGHPNTAWIFSGAGNTRDYVGNVTVNNGVITWVSGDQFVPEITLIDMAATKYRVIYNSPTQMTAEVAIPNYSSPSGYSAKNAAVHDGVLFNGENNVSDNDFHTSTTARTALRVDGRHHIGVDTTGDSAAYALISKPGQKVCLNGFDGCLYFASGALHFVNAGVDKVVTLQ